jgi:hypothetical protein
MASMAEILAKQREQDERIIQSALGRAVYESLLQIIREPLPNEMALLLLRLALAQTVAPANDEGCAFTSSSEHYPEAQPSRSD